MSAPVCLRHCSHWQVEHWLVRYVHRKRRKEGEGYLAGEVVVWGECDFVADALAETAACYGCWFGHGGSGWF